MRAGGRAFFLFGICGLFLVCFPTVFTSVSLLHLFFFSHVIQFLLSFSQEALSSATHLRYCAAENAADDSLATRVSPRSPPHHGRRLRRRRGGEEVESEAPLIVEHSLFGPHPSPRLCLPVEQCLLIARSSAIWASRVPS